MSDEQQEKTGMIYVSGLWKNQSKAGQFYLGGTMGGVKILIFPNRNKTADNHPDFHLLFGQRERKDDRQVDDGPADPFAMDDGDPGPAAEGGDDQGSDASIDSGGDDDDNLPF